MPAPSAQVWEAHRHLNEGIESGEVKPLPWTVFSRDKAQDAFRYLAGGGPPPDCAVPVIRLASELKNAVINFLPAKARHLRCC